MHDLTYKPEWVREDFIDFIAEKINPVWAWKRVKASMQQREALSADFFQLQFRPNGNFHAQQFQPGQSVLLTVVLAGVRQQRSYSVVEILANGDVVIAVKAQGRVSNYLSRMPKGEVVELSQTQGDFVLSADNRNIVLLASGSGITAIYALLQQASAQGFDKIDLLYFSRDDAFHVKLQALAQQYPQLNYHYFNTRQQAQHLEQALLEQLIPDVAARISYACGAAAMMQAAQQIYRQLNLSHQLKTEYFQLAVDESVAEQPVKFLRSQTEFQAKHSLLDSAEKAGLRPSHGCRIGICNTCTCTKVSGATKNLLTGEIDQSSNSQIKLCISQAISPVVINL